MKCFRSVVTQLLIVYCCCLSASILEEAYAQSGEIQVQTDLQGGSVISLKKMISDVSTITTVSVKPGTTVIWLNDTSRVIEVEFVEKQVTLACGSPVGFFVNEQGSYTSQKIVPKAVASICFLEKGEYPYMLLFRTIRGDDQLQGKTIRGKIIVQ